MLLEELQSNPSEQSGASAPMPATAQTPPAPAAESATPPEKANKPFLKERKGKGSAAAPAKKAKAARDVSTNSLTGIEHVFPNGLVDSGDGRFSLCVELGDTNYKDELFDIQKQLHIAYSQILGGFPPESVAQITILNEQVRDARTVRLLPEEGLDGAYAAEYNDILEDRQRQGDNHIRRSKYLTWSIPASSDEAAISQLETISDTVVSNFFRTCLHVPIRRLDGAERIELFRRILRPLAPATFSWEKVAAGARPSGFVAPESVSFSTGEWGSDVFRRRMVADGRYISVMHIRDFGTDLSDEALSDIAALPIPMMVSLVYKPQVRAKMIGRINEQIQVAQAGINEYVKSISKQGGDVTRLAPTLEGRANEAEDLRQYVIDNDQQVLYFQGLIVLFAESVKELMEAEGQVRAVCNNRTIDVDVCWTKTKHALTSALPLAHPRAGVKDMYRSLCNFEAGALNPFGAVALDDDPMESVMIGQSSVTNLPNYIDLGKLPSPHMWIMGITGAGKGMLLKSILSWEVLKHARPEEGPFAGTRDAASAPQMFVFDFHNEYRAVAEAYGGTVSDVSALDSTCINPLAITSAGTPVEPSDVADSSDFFIALTESVLSEPMTPVQISILDRCVNAVYAPHIGKTSRPVLADLIEALEAQPEPEAKYLAKCYEIYTKGSLCCFNGQTNIEDDPILQVFNLQNTQKTLRTFAILTMLQHVKNAVYANFAAHRITWCVVEEAQSLFDRKNTNAADNYPVMRVLESFFAELRKFGLRMICVTQLPEVVLDHPKAKNLFDNSGLFVFLAQSQTNCGRLEDLFSLSQAQVGLMARAEKGNGLLVLANGTKLGFKNQIPKTLPSGAPSALYELFNTDPERAAVAKAEKGC